MEIKVHVQNIGWMTPVKFGEIAGTTGRGLSVEAIAIFGDIPVEYEVHVENIGWQGVRKNGEVAGTEGKGLRIEAFRIRLVNPDGKNIWYSTHVENFGWMDWAKNFYNSGTEGHGFRVEALKIVILDSPVDLQIDYPVAFKKYVAPPAPPAPAPTPQPQGIPQVGRGRVICLNAGHGGSDPGAVGPLQEKHMNLTVALRVGQLLRERGFKVVQTRSSDVWLGLADRPAIANNAGAEMFVSIHHNGSSNPGVSGTEVICYPGSSAGLRLAQLMLNALGNTLGLYKRGIIQRDDSDVTYSNMVAIITEACFASSPSDCNLFVNGGAEKEAQGILQAILAYMG